MDSNSLNKNVLFFVDSLGGGGAERVVSVLSREFAQTGYAVSIVMLRKVHINYRIDEKVKLVYAQDLPVSTMYGKLVRAGYVLYKKARQRVYKPLMKKMGFYSRVPNIDETAFYFYATYALLYREFMKKHKGATAFGFLIRSNIAMLMASKGTGVKTVFCERNNPVRPDMPRNIMKLRDKIYKRCDEAVFQTVEEMEYYTKIKGKKVVIPNAIKDNLPEKYNGERRQEIVNFCRLSKQKNIPLLIDAFEMLLKDYPQYTLRIYGKGDERDNLLGYIEQKRLQEKVFIEDFAPDIHDRIKDAKMFVSTSDFEGLSNTMLEAMAIGLPCVCTDCDGGGARMMIQDHENGLLVPKGDVMAVYSAMKEIIDNKDLAEKLSENATKVKTDLEASKIANMWIEMI